ncbi:MAG: phenylalanine--tRNA ligase subunit alpha, partial [Deltaproteobacteria bacterium]|nr:phenylalanine--tRNA ligase subunit alpha [Deltaproteobacteria bacterium]
FVDDIRDQFLADVKKAASVKQIEEVRVRYLGRKGAITLLAKNTDFAKLTPEQKRDFGRRLNELKALAETEISQALEAAKAREAAAPAAVLATLDRTLPGTGHSVGCIHPIALVQMELEDIFQGMGFMVLTGPEVEREYYNFDALNIPADHPARDMQDTFYINPVEVQGNSGKVEIRDVLRTHTTSIQARVLSRGEFPIKVICFGRVYRNETEDPSHQAMFHQFELLWVDKGLGLPELLSLIEEAMKFLFGKDSVTRYVPKYYPYTQPSFGVQTGCIICRGSGCPLCNGSGFITVGGAGVVHPKVLQTFGFDANLLAGLAFGLGSSRLAIQRAGLSKLRLLYDGDLRYL